MQDAISSKQQEKKRVAPFTADHGVNPGWGVYEERPVIPAFNGVAEIGKLALMFTLWSRVEAFIYKDVGLKPLASAKEEKKHRSVLLESETYLIALLCLLNNDHYSAGGLVDAMVGGDASADLRGNARKRILNRTLPIVGDRYGLIDYSERHMGNSMEYSICRSERLVEFAEAHLVPSIAGVIGASANSSKNKSSSRNAAKTVASKKSATRKRNTTKVSESAVSGKTATGKTRVAKSGGKK